MILNERGYGEGANSYNAAGGLVGIACLVEYFFSNIDIFPEAKTIREMHPQDLTESRKKLTYFLRGVAWRSKTLCSTLWRNQYSWCTQTAGDWGH